MIVAIGQLAVVSWVVLGATSVSAETPDGVPVEWVDGVPSPDHLEQLGADLVDAEAAVRLRAYGELSRLPATAVGSIRVRLDALGRVGLRTERLVDALAAFRRAMGSTRADDDVDLAPGVLLVTRTRRDHTVRHAAEMLLLMRALESLATTDAARLLAETVAMDPAALATEGARIRGRLGVHLAPSYVQLRGHKNAEVRRWASRGLRALGISDPAAAVAATAHDSALLAGVFSAYGEIHDPDATTQLVAHLNDGRAQVRIAAREAVRALGRNAIWRLRATFQEVTGRNADAAWDTDQTLAELCLVFDRERIEEAETALARGLSAHLAGDLDLMAEHYERALRTDPLLTRRREMAPGFADLGAARLVAGKLATATSAYRRAVRLDAEHPQADSWRAQLSYLAAERTLTNGVVDLDGYRHAVTLTGQHDAASHAHDRLSGAWSERMEALRRTIALAAMALLTLFGAGILSTRRNITLVPTEPPTHSL